MYKVDSSTQLMRSSERLSSLSPVSVEEEKDVDVKSVGLELGLMRRSSKRKIGSLLVVPGDDGSSPDEEELESEEEKKLESEHNLFAIVSHESGGGKALTMWPVVRERLNKSGALRSTCKSRGDSRQIGRAMKSPESYTGLLMVGGDGIVQEFVSGAYETRGKTKTFGLMIGGSLPLGVVPCGTDNGICKGLRMIDVDVCLDSILLNRVVPLNILRVSFTSEPINLSLPASEDGKSNDSKNRISVETSSDGQRFHVLSLCGTFYCPTPLSEATQTHTKQHSWRLWTFR